METASGHFMRQTIQAEYTNTPTVRETLRTLIRTKICTNGFGRQNVTDKQKNKKQKQKTTTTTNKQDKHMVNRPMQFNNKCQNDNKQTTAKR